MSYTSRVRGSRLLTQDSNPKNYNDDQDARPYDPRLRGLVRPIELEIDRETGMKNYIANDKGDWATSAAFVKHSFSESIKFGRAYMSGAGLFSKGGEDDDLAEALRLLGQGLHTLEDFGAHTNYVELALIEQGHRDVFAHVGRDTEITLRGRRVWPLVTGTFGMVDFYHSVIGEATDHFTQSEVNEMNNAMGIAQQAASNSNPLSTLAKLLAKVPGTSGLVREAEQLQAASQAQAQRMRGGGSRSINDNSDDYSSSRGLDDFGSTRGASDFPGGGSYGSQSHNYGAPSQSYQPLSSQAYSYQGAPNTGYNAYNQGPPQPYTQAQNPSWGASQPQWQTGSSYQQSYGQQQPYGTPQYASYGQPDPYPQQSQYGQPQSGMPGSLPPNTGVYSTPSVPQQPPGPPGRAQGLEGMPDFDPATFVKQIYPILAFRDKVVRSISAIIEKIPGLEALVERIVETLTVFIFSLLAPFVKPVLESLQKTLQSSSEGVTEWNKKHQYEVWDVPQCSDPTHSMLSKDHFSNILNEPAGLVAGAILKFIAPRVLYAWEHPEVPVERVMQDIDSIFHHPALRDEGGNECHRNMFAAVRRWSDENRGCDQLLNAQAVRTGKNHKAGVNDHAGHGSQMGAHGQSYGSQAQGAWTQTQNLVGLATGHSGQQHHQSSQGGLGGMLHQAGQLIGGGSGGGGRPSQYNSGPVGGLLHQAESFLGGGKPSHGGGGYGGGNYGGGGGAFNLTSLANQIPGVGKYTSSLNQFNKMTSLMGGKRELGDEAGYQGGSRELQDNGDYGDSYLYQNLGMASVGGSSELYESAIRGSQTARGGSRAVTPDPGPLPPPSGYEMYTSSNTGQYQSYEPNPSSQYSQSQQQGYNNYGAYDQSQSYQQTQHPQGASDSIYAQPDAGQGYSSGQYQYGSGSGGTSSDYNQSGGYYR